MTQNHPSIRAQIEAVEFAACHVGRAPPRMSAGVIEEHERRLAEAIATLRRIEFKEKL